MPANGLPPLDQMCERLGARLAFRLRGEFLPAADPPFPGSPEEEEWVRRRETLVLTLLRLPGGWRLSRSWTVAGVEADEGVELPDAELDRWSEELTARGGWELSSFSVLPAGEGRVEFEHEAYEYCDDGDPDSLDLDSWRPPRRWRIERGGNGAERARTEVLVGTYARFLPEEVKKNSLLGSVFGA